MRFTFWQKHYNLHVEIVMTRVVGVKNEFFYAVGPGIKKDILEQNE